MDITSALDFVSTVHRLIRAVAGGPPVPLVNCPDLADGWDIVRDDRGIFQIPSQERVSAVVKQRRESKNFSNRQVINLDDTAVIHSFALLGPQSRDCDYASATVLTHDNDNIAVSPEPECRLNNESSFAFSVEHRQHFEYHEHILIHILLAQYQKYVSSGYFGQILWTWVVYQVTKDLESPALEALHGFFRKFFSHKGPDASPVIPREFRYPALPTTEGAFRVIVLWPAHSAHESLRCQLAHENLHHEFDFEALSYVWGDHRHTRTIELNGAKFAVTANLEVALRNLRFHDSKPRVLWIDALCIDQSSIPERNSQVQQMGRIYRKAKQVIVWLGPETNTTLSAFGAVLKNKERSEKKATVEEYEYTKEEIDALKRLFNRPWFRRTWIVQEVALSKSAILYCGKAKIPLWYMFSIEDSFFSFVKNSLPQRKSELAQAAGPALIINNLWRATLKNDRLQGKPAKDDVLDSFRIDQLSLGFLLYSACMQEASDPRDKVYAVLNLASTDYSTSHDEQSIVRPDYSLSVQQVYTEAARAIIRRDRSLDILPIVTDIDEEDQNRTANLDLPSWVPNWSAPNILRGITQDAPRWLDELNEIFGVRPIIKSDCCEGLSEDTLREFSFHANGRILEARGIIFDSVTPVECSNMEASKDKNFSWKTVKEYMSMCFGTDSTLHLNDEVSERFWQVLYGEWKKGTECLSQLIQRPGIMGRFPSKNGPPTLKIPPKTVAEETHLKAYFEIWKAEIDTSKILGELGCMPLFSRRQQKMFRTSRGYLGRGPPQVREGDIVAVLPGSRAPFVLRKTLDFYQLLGRCSVLGIMNGELIELEKRGGCEFETLLLA
ncbi:MAG: hypothetical protein Q9227_007983 [Pyrenula ochraceoflavens]